MDADRMTVGFHALAALRFYQPVFPSDYEPFRAVAAAMAYAQNPDDALLTAHHDAIQERMDRLHTIVELTGVTRGLLVAAVDAMQLVMLTVSVDCAVDKALALHQSAKDACTGIGIDLL